MTIANHTLNVGTKLRLKNGGFTFTCAQDGNGSNHEYPRSTDPSYNTTLNISAVGTTTANITTGTTYVASTGVLTVKSTGHGLSAGNMIQIATDSLTFTCTMDSNATQHTYPRTNHDIASGRWFEINNKTANTFEINVGGSSYTGTHTFVSAASNGVIRAGDEIYIAPDSLTFTCTLDGNQSQETYPDPDSANLNSLLEITAADTNTFTVNVGPSTISHTYVSGGVVQVGITTNIFPGNAQNSPLGDTFIVSSAPNWNQLTFNAGISTIPHNYVSGGSLTFGHKLKVGTDVALTGLAFTSGGITTATSATGSKSSINLNDHGLETGQKVFISQILHLED